MTDLIVIGTLSCIQAFVLGYAIRAGVARQRGDAALIGELGRQIIARHAGEVAVMDRARSVAATPQVLAEWDQILIGDDTKDDLGIGVHQPV